MAGDIDMQMFTTTNTGNYQNTTQWVNEITSTPYDNGWKMAMPIEWGDTRINVPSVIIQTTEEKNKIPEGVEMKKLYSVYMIYGENRKQLIIKKKEDVIASDVEDAKIKSGLMKTISEEWDNDYLTFIVNEIGEVKVKEKPKEVKNV